MDAAMPGNNRPSFNWLLHGLLLFSLALHAVVLVPLVSRYRASRTSVIELEVQQPQRPDLRTIPVPPRRPPPQARTAPIPEPIAPSPPMASIQPPQPDPIGRPTMMEAIPAAERPQPARIEALAWNPAERSGLTGISGAFGNREDYFSMIRMKIESRKRYPPEARRRQLEGKALVRFTIQPDGSLDQLMLQGRGVHPLLDAAALEAVRACAPFPRPPASLFKGPVPMEIAIVFELT
jgi:protein TonB